MTQRNIELLELTIEKWERKLSEMYACFGKDHCPLCEHYHPDGVQSININTCTGCPIAAHTGESFCRHSPYQAAVEANSLWRDARYYDATPSHLRTLKSRYNRKVRDMIGFLNMLLTKEKEKN